MSPLSSSAPNTAAPSWLGFVMGLLGGFAVSMGIVGLVVGMTLGGGVTIGGGNVGAQLAQNPPAAPSEPTPEPTPPPPAAPVPPVDPATDHIRGNKDAKISVVEYSDLECPYCKRHHPTLQQVMETYGNDVNWVYRHFPLSFHPTAQKSAEASECVAELGGNDAFWKFVDARILAPDSLDELPKLAKQAGVDEKKFQDCLDSGKYAQKVADQMNGGSAAGVQGTPGNFIVLRETGEAKDVSGAVPFANFKSVIDSYLAQ